MNLIKQFSGASGAVQQAPVDVGNAISTFLTRRGNKANAGQYDPDVARIKLRQTASLKGLLSLIAVYVTMAEQYVNYPKAIAPLMARTDFATMFRLLPPQQQAILMKNNQALWLELVQDALPGKVLTAQFFPPLPAGQPARPFTLDLTRQDWLRGIAAGTDLLTEKGYLERAQQAFRAAPWSRGAWQTLRARQKESTELQGLGGLGAKTETVGGGRSVPLVGKERQVQAPIIELRSLLYEQSGYIAYDRITEVAVNLLIYLRNLNRLKDKYYGE
jgi:hypothetical protein